jgi:hypothetical protein
MMNRKMGCISHSRSDYENYYKNSALFNIANSCSATVGSPLLLGAFLFMSNNKRPEVILDVELVEGFVNTITPLEAGHLLKYIVNSEMGIDYKSGNENTDKIISLFKSLCIDSNRKNKPHYLYIIRLKDIKNNEQFLKVGITNCINGRYLNFEQAYFIVTPVQEIEFSTKKLAMINEAKIKKIFSHKSFTPSYLFGGFTECYTLDAENEILSHFKTLPV